MKVLFQGGWRKGRNPDSAKSAIDAYCTSLARHIADSTHELILTSPRAYDQLVADELSSALASEGRSVKESLIFLLSSRYSQIPEHGRVLMYDQPRWWLEERTHFVQQADASVAIGGGKGTADCVQKAFLAEKPVFVAATIPSPSTKIWKRRPDGYHYLRPGDAQFAEDMNSSPDEFFVEVFRVLAAFGAVRHSRRIFVVHGRDHHLRDTLVDILKDLAFQPIVLQTSPGQGRTIIENIEREAGSVGFGFVLYTPDDLGRLAGGEERPRPRQNVLFEHGVLIGMLGRDRTCAIVKGNLEMPADMHGVIYEEVADLSQEAIRIARVLKQAGYEVDVSKLI